MPRATRCCSPRAACRPRASCCSSRRTSRAPRAAGWRPETCRKTHWPARTEVRAGRVIRPRGRRVLLEKPDEQQDDEDEDENAASDIHDPWEPPNEWAEE